MSEFTYEDATRLLTGQMTETEIERLSADDETGDDDTDDEPLTFEDATRLFAGD